MSMLDLSIEMTTSLRCGAARHVQGVQEVRTPSKRGLAGDGHTWTLTLALVWCKGCPCPRGLGTGSYSRIFNLALLRTQYSTVYLTGEAPAKAAQAGGAAPRQEPSTEVVSSVPV